MKTCLFFLLLTLTAQAKPMLAPTLEEGAERSPVVVVASYEGYDGSATYMGGVSTHYRVVEALKGQLFGDVQVRYAFQDGTACLPLEGWKFDPKTMPAPHSRWILFLTPGKPYEVYRGDFGRRPYSDLTMVKRILR